MTGGLPVTLLFVNFVDSCLTSMFGCDWLIVFVTGSLAFAIGLAALLLETVSDFGPSFGCTAAATGRIPVRLYHNSKPGGELVHHCSFVP